MRIGAVTKENYKEYLKLFGAKDLDSLDGVLGTEKEFDHSYEARNARLVAAGHEDGMLIPDGDVSWRKIVPVTDEIKTKLVSTVFRNFLKNGNGMSEAEDGDEIGAIMKKYRENISPKERLSVTWTLGQIVQNEAQRLVNHVKANDPSWTFGEPFDKSIFKNYVPGGVDITI